MATEGERVLTTRAEKCKQAAKLKPRTFNVGEVKADVTDSGTLLLTIEDRLDSQMMHANLDAFQARQLITWLKENFE